MRFLVSAVMMLSQNQRLSLSFPISYFLSCEIYRHVSHYKSYVNFEVSICCYLRSFDNVKQYEVYQCCIKKFLYMIS